MTSSPHNPINLSVHQSADPSVISPNSDQEAKGDFDDLNDSSHDEDNVDVPIPKLGDDDSDMNLVNSQAAIANLGGG